MLEILRSIAENMVAVLNTALKGFSEMQLMLLKGEGVAVSTVASTCISITNTFASVGSSALGTV